MRLTQPLRSNCSSTALSGGATFTGSWESTIGWESITVACKTDVSGSLYVDFADTDGGTTQSTLTYSLAANINEVHRLTVTRPWARVRLVNGSSAQSSLSLQTMVGAQTLLSAPLNLSLGQDADAIAVRSIDAEIDIAEGKRSGYSVVNIFGRNSDVDSGTTPEDVWGGGGVYTGFPSGSGELVTVVSSSANDTSAGSGARTIKIWGLDANGVEQSETITLNGTSAVDSVGTYTRVYKGQVQTSGSSNTAFNAGTITCAHKVTTANVFFALPIGTNETQAAVYTIPASKTGYLRFAEVMVDRSATATIAGALYVKESGKAPRLVKIFSASQDGEHQQNIYGGIVLPALTDVTVRVTSCSTTNVDVSAHMDILVVSN